MNLLAVIQTITNDIDDCFIHADGLIEMGYDPWRSLQTATSLDDLRRRYIQEAAGCGFSILSISGNCKLAPSAIRTIINDRVSQY